MKTRTKIRKNRAKVVDFVTYFEGGTSIMTPAGNPQGLTLDNLCGYRIAAQKGTIYVGPLAYVAQQSDGQFFVLDASRKTVRGGAGRVGRHLKVNAAR